MLDNNSLKRFLEPQKIMYNRALAEIKKGKKMPGWMSFIFPRLRGLGSDEEAYVGLRDISEAKKYLFYPILSARLHECTQAVLDHKEDDIKDIFGIMGALNLHYSMTLFAMASPEGSLFHQVLDRYYDGQMEPKTIEKLNLKK